MDYVEAASALGEAIKESAEFTAWQEAELALMQDEKAQELMNDFKDLQMKLVHGSRARKNPRYADGETKRTERI